MDFATLLVELLYLLKTLTNPSQQYRAQRREWMTTTCNHALYAVVDVYTQHYAVLAPLLSELLQLLQWCVKQGESKVGYCNYCEKTPEQA